MKRTWTLLLLFNVLLFTPLAYAERGPEVSTQRNIQPQTSHKYWSYEVVKVYPHDSNAFTQGLVFKDGFFYEGTGRYGKSELRKVEIETGNILKRIRLPGNIFGEGIAIYGDKIFQLTWKSGILLVYDQNRFAMINRFTYRHEGWGITHDGKRVITSDGTSTIRFLDPNDFTEIMQVEVHDANGPVKYLNELEYIKGEIYANVWKTDKIVRFAPDTGRVTGWIDLRGIYTPEGPAKPVDVLNGIAYDSESDRLFVTGKLWPKLFEIKLIPPEHQSLQPKDQ